jgi:hypothetical protein
MKKCGTRSSGILTRSFLGAGSEDAENLAKEFYPEVETADLVNLPNYNVYVKLMVNGRASGPFSGKILRPSG